MNQIKAIIVAGGFGTRLKPLTDKIPKPMVTVGEKPILEHIINFFKKNGVYDFVLALCYLPEKITSYFGNGWKFGVNIEYIYEDPNSPRGTAGAILPAKKIVGKTFIVTYADILRELNLRKMIQVHEQKAGIGTLNVYKHYQNPKSMILFDKQRRITKFIERPDNKMVKKDFVWSNGSLYLFNKEIFDFILPNRKVDFGYNVFPALLKSKKKIYAYPSSGYFIDIADISFLRQARRKFNQF